VIKICDNKLGILPFGASHDVPVIRAQDITIKAMGVEELCVQVGIIGNVAYVKYSRGMTVTLRKTLLPSWRVALPNPTLHTCASFF
jgi:hypothetical protein